MSSAIEGAQNGQMKEIRGLGDRLSGLEQLLLEAKRLVQEQQKLAAAFVQNQQRASGLRDVSILPDLCASHRQQLLVMQKNHQQIISICNRSGSNIKYFLVQISGLAIFFSSINKDDVISRIFFTNNGL